MSQQNNPAWQGAVEVANARLLTIDEALTRLEAVVPDTDDTVNKSGKVTPPDDRGGRSSSGIRPPRPQQIIEPSNNKPVDSGPAQIPDSSRQALESFLAGRFGGV